MASDPEEVLRVIDPIMQTLMDDDALHRRVRDDVEKSLGRIARDHFPHLGAWPAEQLRRLADRTFRAAHQFASDLLDMDIIAQRKE